MSDKKETQELAVQEEIEVVDVNRNVIELSKPISHFDRKITSVTLELESLTLADQLAAEKDMERILGKEDSAMVLMKPANTAYQMAIAARASGIPVDAFQQMSIVDANKIGLRVQAFLFTGV